MLKLFKILLSVLVVVILLVTSWWLYASHYDEQKLQQLLEGCNRSVEPAASDGVAHPFLEFVRTYAPFKKELNDEIYDAISIVAFGEGLPRDEDAVVVRKAMARFQDVYEPFMQAQFVRQAHIPRLYDHVFLDEINLTWFLFAYADVLYASSQREETWKILLQLLSVAHALANDGASLLQREMAQDIQEKVVAHVGRYIQLGGLTAVDMKSIDLIQKRMSLMQEDDSTPQGLIQQELCVIDKSYQDAMKNPRERAQELIDLFEGFESGPLKVDAPLAKKSHRFMLNLFPEHYFRWTFAKEVNKFLNIYESEDPLQQFEYMADSYVKSEVNNKSAAIVFALAKFVYDYQYPPPSLRMLKARGYLMTDVTDPYDPPNELQYERLGDSRFRLSSKGKSDASSPVKAELLDEYLRDKRMMLVEALPSSGR